MIEATNTLVFINGTPHFQKWEVFDDHGEYTYTPIENESFVDYLSTSIVGIDENTTIGDVFSRILEDTESNIIFRACNLVKPEHVDSLRRMMNDEPDRKISAKRFHVAVANNSSVTYKNDDLEDPPSDMWHSNIVAENENDTIPMALSYTSVANFKHLPIQLDTKHIVYESNETGYEEVVTFNEMVPTLLQFINALFYEISFYFGSEQRIQNMVDDVKSRHE